MQDLDLLLGDGVIMESDKRHLCFFFIFKKKSLNKKRELSKSTLVTLPRGLRLKTKTN